MSNICVRYSLLPTKAITLWQKIQKFIGILPEFEFNQHSFNMSSIKSVNTDVLLKVNKKYAIESTLCPGESILVAVDTISLNLEVYNVTVHLPFYRNIEGRELHRWCNYRNLPIANRYKKDFDNEKN